MKVEAAEIPAATQVRRSLPWLIGAGGLFLFLMTLSHWISYKSLGTVARVSGWLWRPELNHPLTFALLAPFRLLPEAWRPIALNIFTALCAALVLVLLARSVALLPHDVGPENPLRKDSLPKLLANSKSWIPPLLAALLCGLQLSFWEYAT